MIPVGWSVQSLTVLLRMKEAKQKLVTVVRIQCSRRRVEPFEYYLYNTL